MDVDSLKKGIAEFYDESSGLWENVWGEHMHHGFYDPDSSVSLSDHRAAQIRMIEETLRFAGVEAATAVVDVGCGIGGSSRYLARKFGAKCRGITLSPVQAKRAQAIAADAGLSDKVWTSLNPLFFFVLLHLSCFVFSSLKNFRYAFVLPFSLF